MTTGAKGPAAVPHGASLRTASPTIAVSFLFRRLLGSLRGQPQNQHPPRGRWRCWSPSPPWRSRSERSAIHSAVCRRGSAPIGWLRPGRRVSVSCGIPEDRVHPEAPPTPPRAPGIRRDWARAAPAEDARGCMSSMTVPEDCPGAGRLPWPRSWRRPQNGFRAGGTAQELSRRTRMKR